jgi:hypothetical protein
VRGGFQQKRRTMLVKPDGVVISLIQHPVALGANSLGNLPYLCSQSAIYCKSLNPYRMVRNAAR